jgi:hypothetical protein
VHSISNVWNETDVSIYEVKLYCIYDFTLKMEGEGSPKRYCLQYVLKESFEQLQNMNYRLMHVTHDLEPTLGTAETDGSRWAALLR